MLTYLSKQIRENENRLYTDTSHVKTEKIQRLSTQLNYFTDKYCDLMLSMYRNEACITDKQKLIALKKLSRLKQALFKAEARISELEEHLKTSRENEHAALSSKASIEKLTTANPLTDPLTGSLTDNLDRSEPSESEALTELEFSEKIQAVLQKCTTEMLSK